MKIKSNIAAAVAAGALAAAGAAGPAGAVTYTYEHLAGGDINDLSTLNLQFFVTDSFKITDLNLKFESMVHSYVGDLNIVLSHNYLSPDGAAILISKRSSNYYDAWGDFTWDDEGARPYTDFAKGYPVYRSLRPFQGLSVFDGQNGYGLWMISFEDTNQGDIGSIQGWTLSFEGEPLAPVPEPGVWALMILGFGAMGAALRRRRALRAA